MVCFQMSVEHLRCTHCICLLSTHEANPVDFNYCLHSQSSSVHAVGACLMAMGVGRSSKDYFVVSSQFGADHQARLQCSYQLLS